MTLMSEKDIEFSEETGIKGVQCAPKLLLIMQSKVCLLMHNTDKMFLWSLASKGELLTKNFMQSNTGANLQFTQDQCSNQATSPQVHQVQPLNIWGK
jgi:hypothetical protein